MNSFQDASSTTFFARRVRSPQMLSGSTTNSAEVRFIATYKAVNNMLSKIQFSSLLLGEIKLTISVTNSSGDSIRSFPILMQSYPLNAAPRISASIQSQENIFSWTRSSAYRIRNQPYVLSPFKVVPSDISYDRSKDIAFYVISGLKNSGEYIIPFEITESGCSMSGKIRVELVVQNVNSSWSNFGRWMGWFQCRQGPTVCEKQNPLLSLNSTVGLTFISEREKCDQARGKDCSAAAKLRGICVSAVGGV